MTMALTLQAALPDSQNFSGIQVIMTELKKMLQAEASSKKKHEKCSDI